jgi:hypothetical protein
MAGGVEPVAVIRALLLQTAMPDLPLHEGSSFVARVASRGQDGAASLVVAGELLSATVPDEVQTGQTLRLTVAEVTPERVTLRMEPAQQQQPAAQAAPPPPPPAQQPRVRVEDRPDARRSAAGEEAVTIVLETPGLGTLRVRVATTPGSVSATVQVPPAALARAQARADVLRSGLASQVGRPATVSVVPGAVDVRA